MNRRLEFRFAEAQFAAREFALVALLCVGVAGPVFSQAPPIWSGQAQCQLSIQGSDYAHQEVQTWTITGASTSMPGTMPVYPGTWTVAAQGTMQRPLGPQSLAAQWTTRVPETSAPIAVFVRASDNRLIVKLWHSQLRAPGTITGVRQVVSASVPSTPTPIGLAAFEWPFPVIEDVSNSSSISGSGTIVVSGGLLPLQSPTMNGTATCKWQFHKGVDDPSSLVKAPNLTALSIAANSPVPVSTSNAGSDPLGTPGASASGAASSAGAGGAGTAAGAPPGGAASGSGTAGAASTGGAGGAGTAGGAASGGGASGAGTAAGAPPGGGAGGPGTAGAASSGGAGGAGTAAGAASGGGAGGAGTAAGAASGAAAAGTTRIAAGGGATNPANLGSTLGANQQSTGAQAGCTDPGLFQGTGSPDSPNIMGTIPFGVYASRLGNLVSSTDRKFYQFTLPAGGNASITLSGIQAGSDFDLYAYGSDLTPIACSLTRGTSSENVKTSFGVAQPSNTVIVEVKSYVWSSASPSYSLSINGVKLESGTNLPGGLQNRAVPVSQGASGTTVPQGCAGAVLSQNGSDPTTLGTMSAGQSLSHSGNLASATDRHFYQVTLNAGIDANISLSGMQAGSDFDLYVYHSDFTPIGCSLTRGTGADNVKTSFGATPTDNTVVVEVRSYAWSAAGPSYSLSINAIKLGSGTNLLGGLQNRAVPVSQGASGTTVPQSCAGAVLSQNGSDPTTLGTMSAGQSLSDSGNLASATDRHFYQVTLNAGIDANISLSGMQAGSDFDLYVYRSDFTPIGCSLTRGTGADNVKTSFGITPTINTVLVEVRSYAWSAAAPSYSLSINATAAGAGGS